MARIMNFPNLTWGEHSGSAVIASSASVPEPGSFILLVTVFAILMGFLTRRKLPASEGHPAAPRTRDGKTAEV
jgi:hypothetical protein